MMRALLLVLVCGCAGPAPGPVRFANQPPVWQVNDRLDTPEPPARALGAHRYLLDSRYVEPLQRLLALPRPRRAQNVSSIGEVPDSTWFVNRIGVRALTPAEMRRGPNTTRGPDRSGPWTVLSTKASGAAIGLRIADATGTEYLLKFDDPDFPEAETAAEVIAQRLLWAFGYYVPENDIVELERARLVLADDATLEDADGERPMTEADLDDRLALVGRLPDGRLRALSSKILPGKPLGGYRPAGTRASDPNDVVPHQLRRDLRGLCVALAWLDHVDIKPQNTLDMWVRDPADPGRRYVVHYLLDFGKTLGVFARADRRPWSGYRRSHGHWSSLRTALALGLWVQPWERAAHYPELRGVGYFESDTFDPRAWRAYHRWRPCEVADRWDRFWAAKILMRFTPAAIRAAVDQGRLSDPRAAEHVTRVLIERQRAIGRAYFSDIAPLDQFAIRSGMLCFTDLWRAHQLGAEPTHYQLSSHDDDGRVLQRPVRADASAGGHTCVPVATARDDHGYTIVTIDTRRGDDALPAVRVHLARAPETGELRVIGLERD